MIKQPCPEGQETCSDCPRFMDDCDGKERISDEDFVEMSDKEFNEWRKTK